MEQSTFLEEAASTEGRGKMHKRSIPILFLNVFIIATCGLIYELLAGTLASYVLGDSVTQFSLIIGIYLSALGVGAWLSRFIGTGVARTFVEVELGVALLGGLSAPLLFFSFSRLSFFTVILYLIVFAIGVLVGLELPILMRILKDNLEFKELLSRVLALDYIGALVASLLFPIIFVPKLGLVRTSLLFGIFNAIVGLWGTWVLRPLMKGRMDWLRGRAVIVILILLACFVKADFLTTLAEDDLFADEIIYAKSTQYQRIVISRGKAGFQLFLNGHLQFSSADEYRYHESLVHPAMISCPEPHNVLVLGGGDGLAVREILKHPTVESITLVDIDSGMTGLSNKFPPLSKLNGHSMEDPRVEVINEDAFIWIDKPGKQFDAAIVDFPDPNSYSLGKLFTTRFYKMLKARLTDDAAISVQCTSPLFARKSYWCIIRTMEEAGFFVKPYQATVPAFGVWGFALARTHPFEAPTRAPAGLRFLNDQALASLFIISADISPVPVEVNRLNNQILVHYYESEWRHWD